MKGFFMLLKSSLLRIKHSLFTIMCIFALFSTSSAFMLAQPFQVDATASKLTIQFTCVQAIDHRSSSVCVHTQAKAALAIKIKYCTDAYATSYSLKGTRHANAQGNHIWRWTPDTKCRGKAVAYVIETLGRNSLEVSRIFIVK
jgi:hypothetical protein